MLLVRGLTQQGQNAIFEKCTVACPSEPRIIRGRGVACPLWCRAKLGVGAGLSPLVRRIIRSRGMGEGMSADLEKVDYRVGKRVSLENDFTQVQQQDE